MENEELIQQVTEKAREVVNSCIRCRNSGRGKAYVGK